MEILPPPQQSLWPELYSAPALGLVLYGGTAIALRLGHRSSFDFDFFTDRPLDREALEDAFPFIRRSTVLQDQPNTFTVLVPRADAPDQNVKVSFFGAINIGRIGEPETTEDGVLLVASLDDLMATKVKVILQRVEARDYRDIAAMIKADVSLEKGLAVAREMYGLDFQPGESLKALVYFKGGDLHTLSPEDNETLINAVSAVRHLPQVALAAQELAIPVTDTNNI